MAIYDSETNTFDGVPAEDYHRKMRVIQHGSPLGSKSEEEEDNKQYFGYGALVLIAMVAIGWLFSDGWKIALYILVEGWAYLIGISLIAIGIYYAFFTQAE